MTADPAANPGPEPRKPQPGEQFFQQSIDALSRRLAERAGKPSENGSQAAAEARRRALQAYEREHARRLRLIFTGAAAVVATATFAWLVVLIGQPETPAVARPVAEAQPSPSATTASAEPAAPPAQPVEIPSSPAPAQAAATAPSDPPPPAASPPEVTSTSTPTPPSPLGRDEIREVQKRLRGFGFNPGPVDGVAGPQTEVATQRYLETRGQPQLPPTDPQLLDQLRQDPAPQVTQPPPQPQVVQRAGWSGTRPAQASQAQPARPFDPFTPVKVAGAQITQWLQSAFR